MVNDTKTAVIVNFALLYLCIQHCSGRPRPYEAPIPVDRLSSISQQVESLASHERPATGLSIPVSHGGSVFNGHIDESQYGRIWGGHDLHSSFSDLLEAMGGSNHDWFSQAHQPTVNHWHHTPVSSLPSHDVIKSTNWNTKVGNHHAPSKEINPREKLTNKLDIPFDVSNDITDKPFGWINTLNFPSDQRMGALGRDDWGLTSSSVWKIVTMELNDPALPSLLKKAANDDNQNPLKNLLALIKEIDIRNKQFLLAFSSSASGDEKYFMADLRNDRNYGNMKDTHQRLLAWLRLQLDTTSQADARAGLEGPNHEASDSITPFQKTLLDCLKSDLKSKELKRGRWQVQLRPSKNQSTQVNLGQASLTKVAINALGNFYKSSNLNKWKELFKFDHHFVNFYLILKARQHHGSSKKRATKSANWTQLETLPWENANGQQWVLDPAIHQRFSNSLKKFKLSLIENKFLPVKEISEEEELQSMRHKESLREQKAARKRSYYHNKMARRNKARLESNESS
ncbi:hypothetical protein PGT21_031303 [Puccinia graminis f. sp. tritici]|uniref:Uncharacterized protein n=2 Tax=Puccinia graminis f. sp. tritici TaxID=56615 RepID=E3KRN8_PUCGT|nr:uncharacterized protein PGTG_12704 [Puccinia graminis f. sp. tritici CRL 75-36-700-3]EFP86963.2 hypothetical protein PGTG_12704 [Puccinia graminis f. sp. tritici CRL 75-36-700-3]KAA1101846.1 hypothetical protein PGT21_031303 [Puccinia graminis f. sp. tritici]